ncbi:DNA polymerase IV [Kaistia dalseonensis]|uniref:DNA polymerase IV n=1 Tax=Kaistia dalseonensis TaxID=410840 RepID=A0ABU0H352_9HYPH|nr:DNA polymerase IV [Kaistia dalseonensis]MCX5494132.1 DNA polymerase IV [Kaistia dalseonensis]MDQ0436711.1 DNA polymerase-4 [Kaistia dalseonensis]
MSAPSSSSTLTAFCRDCLAPARGPGRCRACGSPRLAIHPELGRLTIAHVDCDAFYASIEKRDDPSLADKPLIIGGGRRGVVSTACYIARIKGVRSAMPMFKALALCPEAVVIRPNMEKYVGVGRQIRALMQELTPLVEPISIDEAFMDLSGTERLHGTPPAITLARFARRVETEIGVTISVGLSFNKFLAKIASDQDKPKGFSVIGREEAIAFLAVQPVGLIWGVGKAFEAKLAQDGLKTIGQLQRMDEAELARRYGSMGLRLARLARADDRRAVNPRHEAKSIGAETTFNHDHADLATLRPILRTLSEKVSGRLKRAELAASTVTLKLKSTDFKLRTRNRQLADPTRLADRIFRTAEELLARETDGTAYRLIGVSVSDFADPRLADPDDLVDPIAAKRAAAEAAIDKVRGKFGREAVGHGLTFRSED